MEGMKKTPVVGSRIVMHGHRGTVKFVGEVHGTSGTWLGVEWDDPTRGKHSGEKDGNRYFTCTVPGAGSFVRASPSVSCGQSFLQALTSKYVELPHANGQKETLILGSSNGVIEVEAVGLDKIRNKLSNLERLRDISLDSEYVAFTDSPGDIRATCPNIRCLDLSNGLLPSWHEVARIASELPKLEVLSVNRNRFKPLTDIEALASAFSTLVELRINGSMTTWFELIDLTTVMPKLRYVELGYNRLRRLSGTGSQNTPSVAELEVLNLDCNELEEWNDVMMSTARYTSLARLILTSNHIRTIPPPAHQSPNRSLRHIGLQDNLIADCRDMDSLNAWIPELETLNISGNPVIVTGSSDFRPLTIARLPSLLVLNGTPISPKERSDSEIFYLSHIARSNLPSDEERAIVHPRWKELCGKHGTPDGATVETIRDTLASRLITVYIHRCADLPTVGTMSSNVPRSSLGTSTLRVLPSMSMRAFRLKLLKMLKESSVPAQKSSRLGAWLMMDDNLSELDLDRENVDLAWYGIQDGSHILLYIGQLSGTV